MTHWIGKLFVLMDDQGQEYVSTDFPAEQLKRTACVRAYSASGPYAPIGWRKAVPVANAVRWMTDLEKNGFWFEPALE